jgi:hypothetical protein
MRLPRAFAFAVAGLALSSSSAFADVQLTIQNGRVSLTVKDATVRQVLSEWARIGQTRIVNLDRIAGGPVTLQLSDVPEEQALDVLLRAVSGYVLAPRQSDATNLSRFDRIIVMPTSTAPPAAAARAPFGATPPGFQPPQFPTPPTTTEDDQDDDRQQAPNVIVPPPVNRGPVFNTFPQPQVVNPGQAIPLPAGVPGVFNPANPVQGGIPVNPTVYNPQHLPSPPAPTGGPLGLPAQQPQPAAPSPFPSAPTGGVAVPGMVAPAPPTPQPQQQGLPRPINVPGQ